MASRTAILRAAQASPGPGRPTPAPQGSGSPWIGQLPGYGTEPGVGYDYSAYGPFLPRPPRTFTEGAFGPFSPILPVPVDQPPPGFPRAQPRRWQYRPGYDLPVGEPGQEGYKLASFSSLKSLADAYSILRTCLERRKNEIRALEWDIVLTADAANAYQGDRAAMRDFGERQAKAKKFFRRPDPNYLTFSSFLHALMDQVFVIDAASLYMCPKRGRGLGRGLLGSDLDCLWLLDGATIRPLVGLHGEVPDPPAPAFEQYLFGVPRSDYTTMLAGLDLDGSGFGEDDLKARLRGDQLIYYPYLQRADTPYGFSLVEQALIPIMTGLRKQAYQLDYFNESTVPRVYISPGDTTMTPNQIRELQDALNAVAGDIAWAFKIQVLPPGSKVMPQKDMQIVDDSDNWIATEVAMVCDVQPMEIGLIPKVSAAASPFAAREMAQASRSIHERTATKPTLSYICEIFDTIIQQVCGQHDMRFVFEGMEQTQDLAALTDMGIKQVQSGVKTIDEFRDDLHMTRFNLPETREPVVFTQMGPVPLGQAAGQAQQEIAAATAAVGEGHRAGGGTPQRKALPAGTSGQGRMNGPVTQRQARRGGALAPAHATGEGAPGHSGGKAAPKAALAELEALGRHLRKGMPAAEWVPQHIDGVTMAMITEDLGKGLSAGYVISQARSAVEKFAPAQSPQQAQQQRARQQMAQIAAQYQAQVQAAFASALGQAQGLIAAWIAGTLAVTAAVLAGMIAELIRVALLAVLTRLWTAAFAAAAQEAGASPEQVQAALEAFLATEGEQWASVISSTGETALLAAIRAAILAGDASSVMARLAEIFGIDQRAETIAVTEVTRAWNAAVMVLMRLLGVAFKVWVTREDGKVCAVCRANAEQGAVPLDQPFRSGDLKPLAHPRCRCRVAPWAPPKAAPKVLRREVGLNGQETWQEYEPQDNPAGGGGRVFQPHRADGSMYVPGATTGTEPPRWDGSEPWPVTERAPDADDDGDYGQAAGIGSRPGTYWPAQYMDGYWPAPHGHGTRQAPVSSPGAANGRPPNSVGKRSPKGPLAAVLESAPEAEASAVRAQMASNFPPKALAWIGAASWRGPVAIPLDLVDWDDDDAWAARHQQGKVDHFARLIQAGEHVDPPVAVAVPGRRRVRLVDGHHRSEAYRKLGRPVIAWAGTVRPGDKRWTETHSYQLHQGDDPQNKSFTAGNLGDGSAHGLVPYNLLGAPHDESSLPGPPFGRPYCAGLVIRAADTGRVLMLQRSAAEADDGAGLLEWPGGHAEQGESLLAAALREWAEEVGLPVPPGQVTGHWESSNGVYAGHVMTVPSEGDLDLGARDLSANPDSDEFVAAMWVDPAHLGGNRAVREEVRSDLPLVLAALDGNVAKAAQTSAEILREYWTHEGHPGPTQYALEQKIRWGEKDDWYRCVDELTPYLGDGARGYCNLRHKEVLGYWPAQHAQMEAKG